MILSGMFDKRTRYKRPWSLLIFGVGFLILPFYNYYFVARVLGQPLEHVALNLARVGPLYTLLMLLALVVGAGLLAVQKWGWFAAMAYSGTLIVYNTYIIAVFPTDFNYGAIARTIVGTLLLIYFGRKDISAPYFKMYPRGWRLQKRPPVRIDLRVNDTERRTCDFSARGFYVEWPECALNPNDAVTIRLNLDGTEQSLRAGVVRVDPGGAGIAFRGLNRATRKKLAAFVKAQGRLANAAT